MKKPIISVAIAASVFALLSSSSALALSREMVSVKAPFAVEQIDGRPVVQVTNLSHANRPVDIELIIERNDGSIRNSKIYANERIRNGESKTYLINDEGQSGLLLMPMHSPYPFIVKIYSSDGKPHLLAEFDPVGVFTVAH